MAATAAALLVAGLAGAGCGGGSSSGNGTSSDQLQVAAVARKYDDAISARDASAACALMTPALRRQFIHRVHASPACTKALEHLFNEATQLGVGHILSLARKATAEDIRIRGNTAYFKLRLHALGKTLESRAQQMKTKDGWRMSCCIGGVG